MNEFPRQADESAVRRLVEALQRELVGDDIGRRHRETARTWGVAAGFTCRSLRAEENLGAFICDVRLAGRALTGAELLLAFRPWFQDDPAVGATLDEYGLDEGLSADAWLQARLEALSSVLAGVDPGGREHRAHSDAGVLENPHQRPH